MRPVLEGLRVIDLTTGIAGPGTAVYLADQGAEVIRIEQPPGNETADPAADGGAGFVVQNRNKRSLTLNLGVSRGQSSLR